MYFGYYVKWRNFKLKYNKMCIRVKFMISVRRSKFKNIYDEPRKQEQCFDQRKLFMKVSEPPLNAINAKYVVVLINRSTVDIMKYSELPMAAVNDKYLVLLINRSTMDKID